MLESLLIYLLLGAFAGFVAGLFGVGGGLILVPALVWLFREQGINESVVMHMALGTSLATIVITSLSSTRAHHRRGAVVWSWVKWLAPGLSLGAFAGGLLAETLSTVSLQWLFGLFEVMAALYLLLGAPVSKRTEAVPVPAFEFVVVGGVIGMFSALFGIGGGTMSVPYLSWRGVVIQRAVAASAACGFPIALVGGAAYIAMGWDNLAVPQWSLGYLYGPAFLGIASVSLLFAPLGAKVAHVLPVSMLKRLFAVMMLLMGVFMIGLH